MHGSSLFLENFPTTKLPVEKNSSFLAPWSATLSTIKAPIFNLKLKIMHSQVGSKNPSHTLFNQIPDGKNSPPTWML